MPIPTFPLIIEHEYDENDSMFSFRKMGNKRIFKYIKENNYITISKADELHLTVKETIIIFQQFREWLFRLREIYQASFGEDETFSVQFLINNLHRKCFNNMIAFSYNETNQEIILESFNVPINIQFTTFLRRTQETLDWIGRDFEIWNTELRQK